MISLLLSFISFSIVIAIPTIAIAVFVALSRSFSLFYFFTLLFAIAFKVENERQLHREQYRKEAMNQCTKKEAKNANSDNFCYRKVGRAITFWKAVDKFQYCNSKIILQFGGTNNNFIDCSYILVAPLRISINPSGK